MKQKQMMNLSVLAILLLSLSSCEAIAGIFKAGVWSGVLLVVGIIALIIFIISRMSSGNK